MALQVSIQQAAANAFATWLSSQMPDVRIEPRWPAADKGFPGSGGKVISVIPAGRRRDTPIDLRLLSKTNNGATQVDAVWQVAACYQPFQLDVWATAHVVRDDIIARLDNFLHAGESALAGVFNANPVGTGVLVAVQNGFEAYGTTADFYFEEPDLDDTADSVGQAMFRAAYRGGANFMLAVKTTTASQKVINFQEFVSQSDGSYPAAPDTYRT